MIKSTATSTGQFFMNTTGTNLCYSGEIIHWSKDNGSWNVFPVFLWFSSSWLCVQCMCWPQSCGDAGRTAEQCGMVSGVYAQNLLQLYITVGFRSGKRTATEKHLTIWLIALFLLLVLLFTFALLNFTLTFKVLGSNHTFPKPL